MCPIDPERFGLSDPGAYGMTTTGPAPVPRRRGRILGGVALVLVVAAAVLLGVTAYLALDAIRVVSFDPLGAARGWMVAFVVVAVGAVGSVLIALVALLWCRPRRTAGLALVASVVLPALAVGLAGTLGFATARRHAVADLTVDGGLVDSAADVAQSWNVDVGPFRGLLKSLLDAAG